MYSLTQEGSGALRRPGSSRHRASPWAAPVPPTERAGSEGSYECCLRQRPPLVAGATTFLLKGSMSLDSQTSGRISIGRRLYGQARRQRIWPCVFLCRIRTLQLPTNPVPLPPPKGGTMGAERWRQVEFMAAEKRKPYNRASPGGKQANLAALAEMHPFWC